MAGTPSSPGSVTRIMFGIHKVTRRPSDLSGIEQGHDSFDANIQQSPINYTQGWEHGTKGGFPDHRIGTLHLADAHLSKPKARCSSSMMAPRPHSASLLSMVRSRSWRSGWRSLLFEMG